MEIDYPEELLEYILVDNGSKDRPIEFMKDNILKALRVIWKYIRNMR